MDECKIYDIYNCADDADDIDEVGAPTAEHAEGGLGGEVERDPANKTLQGEPESSRREQPGDSGSQGKLGNYLMQASSSQEFSALDRANKQREVFHAKKMEELGSIMASFEEMIEAKKKDNELLEEEVVKLEQELKEEEAELEAQSKAAEEEMAKVLIMLICYICVRIQGLAHGYKVTTHN